MNEYILNTMYSYLLVVYQLSGDRNLCAGVHYATLQVFIKEITHTFDYLE